MHTSKNTDSMFTYIYIHIICVYIFIYAYIFQNPSIGVAVVRPEEILFSEIRKKHIPAMQQGFHSTVLRFGSITMVHVAMTMISWDLWLIYDS